MRPHLLCVGGEDHFLRIPFLIALRDKGFRISAAGSSEPSAFTQSDLDYHLVRFHRFLNPLSDWIALKEMSKLIAELRPGIVQCFDTKLNVLVPLAARDFRDVHVVSTINGLGWLYSSHSPLALGLRPIYRALQRLADRSTAATVFQNHEDRAFFTRHRMVGAGPTLVISGSGIDIERFEQAAMKGPSPAEIRRALGLGSSEIVITVTRMTRQKGIPTLLKAAALVHRNRPNVRFLLVGPRETEGRMAVSQAEFDRYAPYVLTLGARSDVPALLRAADVFAFPTELREGVPRVLLEAAVAGCPIVTTRMPGCTDVIREGWNGLLVPPHASHILADRILDLLRDRENAQAMGVRAAEFVKREFNLGITVTSYATIYEQLLKLRAQSHANDLEPPDLGSLQT